MKKIAMVLGAGRGQVPIIDLCHKYGWETVVVSPKGNYPGFAVSEYSAYADVRDKETVLEIAQKYNVQLVLSDQLDEAVPTAAYVSERMNLRGIPYDVALKFRNKVIMKEEAQKLGVKTAKFFVINNKEDAYAHLSEMNFPVVIKPSDSSASRGITKVYCEADVTDSIDYALQYSRNQEIIIEEYIEGALFSVDAFTMNGKVTNLDIGYARNFELDDKFITKEIINVNAEDAVLDPMAKAVLDTNKCLIEGFGYPFGISHAEYVVNEKGEVYLIEAAARGGGNISTTVVPAATGINVVELYAHLMLGVISDAEIHIERKVAGVVFFLLPEGKIKKISGLNEIKKIPGVSSMVSEGLEQDAETKGILDKSSRYGPVYFQCKSLEESRACIEKIRETLNIEIEGPDGITAQILWQ